MHIVIIKFLVFNSPVLSDYLYGCLSYSSSGGISTEMISYARSAGLVGPVDSADPVDPADRVDQVGSAGLVDPVDSAGLIDPSYPFDMLCYASYWNEDF
jgi:hypothetical protein